MRWTPLDRANDLQRFHSAADAKAQRKDSRARLHADKAKLHRFDVPSRSKAVSLLQTSRQYLSSADLSCVDNLHQSQKQCQNLLLSWHAILHVVPLRHVKLWKDIANTTDQLAHMLLDHHEKQQQMVADDEAAPIRQPGSDPSKDIVTAMFAWGKFMTSQRHHSDGRQDKKPKTIHHDEAAMIDSAELLYERWQQSGMVTEVEIEQQLIGALIYCISHSYIPDASDRAYQWLQTMLEQYDGLIIDDRSCHAVLRAYAKRGRIDELMRVIEEVEGYGKVQLSSSVYTSESIIQAWANSNIPGAGEHVFNTFQKGIQEGIENKADQDALRFLAGSVLKVHRRYPDICHRILLHLENVQRNHPEYHILQIEHICATMAAWADIGNADKVEELLAWAEQLHERSGSGHLKPTFQMSTIVLSAHTKQRTAESLSKAEAILERMEKLFILRHEQQNQEEEEGGSYGNDTTARMDDQLSNYPYNLLLNAYARNRDVKDRLPRVQGLLQRMEQIAKDSGHDTLLPDKISYNSLVHALAIERQPGIFRHIDHIFETMMRSGRKEMLPDATFIATVLDVYEKSNRAAGAKRAEQLMKSMRTWNIPELNVHDQVISTIMIKIHSKHNGPYRARGILNAVREEYKNTGNAAVQPNAVPYMTTVKAFALNQVFDAAEQVSGVLEDMVHDYKTLNSTCRPTVSILQEALFIISCNRNSQISMLEKADRIVEIAQELKITTHRKFWNTYIAVCGRELEHKEEAWKAAQLAFDNLHSSEFSVDANTYVLMLRACSNLMESSSSLVLTPEDEAREARRKGIILELVKRCKKDGMFKSKVERVVETLGVQIPAAVPVEIQERAPLPAQMQETVDDEEQDFGERENDDHGEDRLEPAIKVDLPPMPKP